MSAWPKPQVERISPEVYFEIDDASKVRHEYLDGTVTAMSGGTIAHAQIVLDVSRHLGNQLDGKPCEPFSCILRLSTPKEDLYTYPDIMVACNPEFYRDRIDTITNPVVIIEVLSPSTEMKDRTEKFNRYRQIPTLIDYVLISQEQMLVEHRSRSRQTEAEHWWLRFIEDPEEELVLDSINCRLRLADIYKRVQFASNASAAG